MGESLFSHLVFRFSTSPENLATESLCFILNQSASARHGFWNFLSQLNINVPEGIIYNTQETSSEDQSIPDLVGKGQDGSPLLYAEAKFWAGLTENQPVTYLRRMAKAGTKALVFIAPAKRFPTLWPELVRWCADEGFTGTILELAIPEVKIMRLPGTVCLVLVSWRMLLNAMQIALQAAGEREMESNLLQLQGLCARMDETAFLPVTSEELTGNIGTRILQYHDIVDEVTGYFIEEGIVSKKGLHATGARGTYIQYLVTEKTAYALSFSAILWNKYGASPLWLGIAKPTQGQWSYHKEAREKLLSYEMSTPPRLFTGENNRYLYVPLFIEPGQEKAEVVKSIIQQVRNVFDLLEN